MSKIKITDTSLRDGHQSLWATRMTTDDMLPIIDILDKVGYHSLEVWGGATFDVCIRYLNEDPWERLKKIRSQVKDTKLQMLLRGQSLVGYTHYPDDIVYKFVDKSAENGIDIFRVFDALNDMRNLETCIKAVKKTGKHVQPCVVYTISPVHSLDHFVQTALSFKEMGADSICIKDMAGLLAPYASFELVKVLKEKVGLPIHLHTHYIGGLAMAACLKGVEAGADVLDTASVPMAFGSSQPPVETIVRALQGTEWDTGLDLHLLFEIAEHFEKIRKHKGFERGVTRITDMKVFEHQVPGGMITNLVSQLEEQKASHRLNEVLEEIPKVRAELGYPPLVTPTSQIIGTQAVLNVLMGERYKLCPGEVKDYVRGYYGKPPAPMNKEIVEKIIGQEEIITGRPADLLEPGWEKAEQEVAHYSDVPEDILTYALFPQVALKFFEYRKNRNNDDIPQICSNDDVGAEIREEKEISVKNRPKIKKTSDIRRDEEMNLEQLKELILLIDKSSLAELELQKDDFRLNLRKSLTEPNANPTHIANKFIESSNAVDPVIDVDTNNLIEVLSPMVGTFYASSSPESPPYVKVGDKVEAGQTLCILEAMKLFNEIKAEVAGTVVEICVDNAEPVEFEQVLILIQE